MDNPFSIIVNVDDITHEQWLGLRRTGIGGSDAGGVVGMSRWSSPLSVWADKRGLLPEQPDNDAMEYGRRMEPTLREWFHDSSKELLPEAVITSSPCMLRSTSYPWALANLDGLIETASEKGGLELKTADSSMAKYWGEGELPDGYYCQVQHYMAVTDWPFFYVFCLLGKHPLIRYVLRNQAFIDDLMERERRLWEMIEANTMPAPSGLDCDDDVLSILYQGGGDEVVEVSGEIEELMAAHVALKEEIDARAKERDELSQRIKIAMGNAKKGQGSRFHANWSRFPVNRIDTTALRRDLPEIAKKYTKESKGERFIVAPNTKKDGGKDED